MKQQPELKFSADSKKPGIEKVDAFAAACRPLAELLDSVRQVEGFPVGSDEDILALSDPPYYTACPNPYLNDFIARYGQPYDEITDNYERTPFVGDISEGKNDPIYNAHSYHTKVPHKAIMPFIKHYTEAGDIVFDGFCGTGMTGVAAQMLGRKAILSDLSPAATFIAYNYNTPVDVAEFEREARRILGEVEKECGWMYETLHSDGKSKGRISYTVWSDVFICPYCNNEYVFWEAAVDTEAGKVNDDYQCPHCQAKISKRECKRAEVKYYDAALRQEVIQARQVPVLINYSLGNKRYEKIPDKHDLDLIDKINNLAVPYWFPTDRMPEGYNTEQPKRSHGVTHVHHFYTKRNLWVLGLFLHHIMRSKRPELLFMFSSMVNRATQMNRIHIKNYFFGGGGCNGGYLKGTLYISSIPIETSVLEQMNDRINWIKRAFNKLIIPMNNSIVSTSSADQLEIEKDTIDYIFTDPPFGSNLMYSELNFLWEAWHKVKTNNRSEAIVNDVQQKGLLEYKNLMTACFREMYRILKPNRWMTVVFHNSKAAVWNVIQEAMTKAGFIIAQVTVLDKKQGSFKQVTSAGAVKNDLIINAYKPKKAFAENFLRRAGEGLEKEFIADYLAHLPKEINIGRSEQMLYSKMLAHYVQRGYEIRLNASQFYSLLREDFKLIDGCWFNDDQVLPYEEWKKRQGLDTIRDIKTGQQVMFISDEKSALVWLYSFINIPQDYSAIYTAYHKMQPLTDDKIPELRELLDQNFIFEDGKYRRPYTEAERQEIEARREKDLARSFEQILNAARTSNRKLKEVRKEAIILGFTQAYREKRFEDIMTVAQRLDPNLIDSNGDISDFVEIARLKTGADI